MYISRYDKRARGMISACHILGNFRLLFQKTYIHSINKKWKYWQSLYIMKLLNFMIMIFTILWWSCCQYRYGHPRIIQIIGVSCQSESPLAIIYEYMKNGSLHAHLHEVHPWCIMFHINLLSYRIRTSILSV